MHKRMVRLAMVPVGTRDALKCLVWSIATAVFLISIQTPTAARASFLLSSNAGANSIGEYNTANLTTVTTSYITGSTVPGDMAEDTSGHLFVISNWASALRLNVATGVAMPFSNPINTILSGSLGIAVNGNGQPKQGAALLHRRWNVSVLFLLTTCKRSR